MAMGVLKIGKAKWAGWLEIVCVCVCVCVHARARACVCVWRGVSRNYVFYTNLFDFLI